MSSYKRLATDVDATEEAELRRLEGGAYSNFRSGIFGYAYIGPGGHPDLFRRMTRLDTKSRVDAKQVRMPTGGHPDLF